MRYDDMIGTVMALPRATPVARQIVWRQLIDLLAQGRADHARGVNDAFRWLEAHQGEIAPSVRASSARSIARRVTSPALVAYFARDDAAIAAPVLAHAMLSEQDWAQLLPTLPVSARAIVRERRDLSDVTRVSLSQFGSADYALDAPGSYADEQRPGPTSIAEVVARIEAFRAKRDSERSQEGEVAPSPIAADNFVFETDDEGVICAVSGAPPYGLIGLSIGEIAQDWLSGVDGQAAAAFQRRSAFSAARLTVAGRGQLAGEWLIDAAPVFDAAESALLGYRGQARRPLRHERARIQDEAGDARSGMRELAHELRTPLTAIIGFAEMIEMAMVGPLIDIHRTRAAEIRALAEELLAQIGAPDSVPPPPPPPPPSFEPASPTDLDAMITLVGRRFAPDTDARQIHLRVERNLSPMLVAVDAQTVERLLDRMLAHAIASTAPGSIIILRSEADARSARLLMRLTDPAGHVGLGNVERSDFGLRQIRAMARDAGIAVMSSPTGLNLSFPVARSMQMDIPQSG